MKREINEDGLNIIKYYEGLRLDAYKDLKGIWTIGYGHTGDVVEGQHITSIQAELLLKSDLSATESGVDRLITSYVNSNEFSACVSLAYNIGVGAFKESTLLKYINDGRMEDASNEFLRWDKVNKKPVKGLIARRRAERDLFIK